MPNRMIVLSVTLIFVCVLGCKSSTPELDSYRQQYINQVVSMQHLREIGQAVYSYLVAHDGVPAPSLATLVEEGLLESENLISPMSGRGPLKTDENGVPTEPGDYIYIPVPDSEASAFYPMIMAYEKPENYHGTELGEGTLALSTAYGVEWMDIEDFREALAKTEQWLAEHKE